MKYHADSKTKVEIEGTNWAQAKNRESMNKRTHHRPVYFIFLGGMNQGFLSSQHEELF